MASSAPAITIGPVEFETGADRVRARSTVRGPGVADDRTLWFDVGPADAAWLSRGPHGALAALLMPAMRTGSPLTAGQPIDPVFLRNVRELQRLFRLWRPDRLTAVAVGPAGELPQASRSGKALGVFFSSGLDSLHATWRASQDPLLQGHGSSAALIPVHGFDIPLANTGTFDYVAATARRVADEIGWRAVPVRTNLKEAFMEPDTFVSWTREGHGAGLAAVAHALDAGIQSVYVGSTNPYKALSPWGSHPLSDHLWSSSGLDVVHVGADTSRLEKIAELAAHRPDWLGLVRVCSSPVVAPAPNCGRCEKCVRTVFCALAAGALDLVAPSFRVDVRRDVRSLLPRLYTTQPAVVDLYAEIADGLERRPETSALAVDFRRHVRYLRPGPVRRIVRAWDSAHFGGALDRAHSRLVRLLGRR